MGDELVSKPQSSGSSDMRASDRDREQAAERLREALVEGRFGMDEFESRLDTAYRAETQGELVLLTRDLPTASVATQPAPAGVESWADRVGHEPTSRGGFALWGGFSRKGRWTVARRFTAFALMGGGGIDLRGARFEDSEVTLRLFTFWGGITVVVPTDLDVQVTGLGVMGGIDERGQSEPTPGSPRVNIKAFALMGGIGVRRKSRKQGSDKSISDH
ncbi:DUF1707 domain-containing protein [Streptomyces californicus]|uniref:DUF1707 domain-containing protein n=1 Tax=Streptomyces californicus TaxID=67351 RepID=UPI00367DDDC2